jgi:protein-tyrosine phosphatase
MIDLHTHVLPGVDDGAEDWEQGLAMLRIAEEDGIGVVAATPHFIPGSFAPPGPEVKALATELELRARAEGLTIRVTPGHEVRAGAGLVERLRKGEILAYDPEQRYLLIEMPGAAVPDWMDRLVFELEVAQVVPILAHPERNNGIIRNPMRLRELIERGCRTQVTAGSFLGRFGDHVARTARLLLELDMVHIVASDAHEPDDRRPVLSEAYAALRDARGEAVARALCAENPRYILESAEFWVPEPKRIAPEEAPGLLDWFGRFLGRRGKDGEEEGR